MFFILSLFWFIRTAKIVLFWIYLWQLKEYHIGRFLDHFRTHKGKKLIFHPLQIFKIILAGFCILNKDVLIISPLILFLLYFVESTFAFRALFGKKIKIPVFTKKTTVLISVELLTFVLFPLILFFLIKNLFWFTFWLLVFDIFTPKITSIIVLSFQPFVIFLQNKILEKAKKKREKFKDLLVIGITGSYGKTSTKEFLATILSRKFHPVKSAKGGVPLSAGQFNRVKVLKTKEHQNSEIGISQCILNDLKPEHEIFVVETGAYNLGKIKQVCEILQPKIGILTGINEQHMATFGSQENIIKAKFELIESLPEDGVAIFNGDNEFIMSNVKGQMSKLNVKSKIFYSVNKKMDIWAEDIKIEKEYLSFKVKTKRGETADFKVNVLGKQNILNILGAVLIAKELGMTFEEISQACQKIKPEQAGMTLKEGIKGLNIIDASYSANPTGIISHLEYLKIWPNKKIIIMPCLIELGKASKEVHKKIGKKIAETCDLAIITTKDRFKEIKEGSKNENILFIENPYKIFEKIKTFCKEDDVVLLEGRLPKEIIDILLKQ